MIAPRVTALALAGLLIATSPATPDLEPAAATSPTAPGAVAAPTTQDDGERSEARAESRTAPRRPLRSEVLPPTSLEKPQHGSAAVRRLGTDLPAVAKAHDMQPAELRTTLLNDETLWVDPSGRLFVKEELHAGDTFDAAQVAAPAEPLDQTLALHSKPGSQHVVHLDFDGVDLPAASDWSTGYHLPAGAYEGWDPMGDGPAFSDAERAAIQEIWARVAEDFAPFDVDVTTADPGDAALRVHAPGDSAFGTRLVVSDSAQAAELICESQCGGVAWIDAITTPSSVAEPAWVFSALNSQSPKAIAEAASHEVGHTFGLRHDGIGRSETDWDEYYGGAGTWAPIMGAAYDAPVSQWSNGFYQGATNSEDDVAKIAAIAGHRTDEGGDGWSSPLRVTDGAGHVGASSDRDVYLVDDCVPGARAAAVTTGSPANLDVSLTLARPSGTGASPVTVANPALTQFDTRDERPWYGVGAYYPSYGVTGLDASVDIAEGGPWLLEVRGGEGVTTAVDSYDYYSYGSMGAYDLRVEGCATPMVAPARPSGLTVIASGADLVATWTAPTNDGGTPLTGYRVTLSGQDPVDLPADATSHTFPGAAALNVTVGVGALNAMGAGAAATVTWNPTTVPSQVTDVSVVTDDLTCEFGNEPRCIEVVWHSPDSNGGSPVTHYEFWQGQDGEWWQIFEGDFPSTGKYEKWTNRFNPVAGEAYDYRIVAVNANGAGAAYDFEALLKGSPARITPTIATDRDDRTVTVTWETPFDGGEPIQHISLSLTKGDYSEPVDVTLPAGTTSYTFTGVKTGPKHVFIAAANIWGPVKSKPGYDNTSDTSFTMPPISPDPGPIPNNTIQATVLSKDTAAGTGSLRVFWEPNVPVDPDHDPILWYDVCVDVIGEIHLPDDAIFGDGATRGTDLCGDRKTLALTVDATDEPFIDLTGLTLGDHYVTVTPVNPGGPAFMPSMGVVNFDPTAITCPTEYTVDNGQLRWVWEWTETNVNYWNVRARRLPDTDWTVWASGQAYYLTGVYQRPVIPGEWEIEVTAALRNGRFGPPVVCAVTVPEPTVVPPTDPGTPIDPGTPTEPTPEPSPEPTPEPTPVPTTDPLPPAPAPVPGPVAPTPVPAVPSAPGVPSVKPGSKGGATTVTVKWSTPASAGSSAITGYQVVVYKLKGSKLVVKARTTVPVSKRTLTLKLKQGTYRVAVRARNAVGWSPASKPSKAVQPR